MGSGWIGTGGGSIGGECEIGRVVAEDLRLAPPHSSLRLRSRRRPGIGRGSTFRVIDVVIFQAFRRIASNLRFGSPHSGARWIAISRSLMTSFNFAPLFSERPTFPNMTKSCVLKALK
jgi:hypothetical protein